MSLGNFFRRAAPIAATVFGGPAAGAVVGGAMGMWGARQEAKGYEKAGRRAGQTALGAFNYLQGSPIGQSYLPMGGAAVNQQGALLGLGGDQAAADAAYQNYLTSTGYQGQMEAGQQAITGSAAARGMLGSGSTLKGLQRFGHQLGAQSFNNYLGQLQGVAGMGLQAGGLMGQVGAQGYGNAAHYQYSGMTGGADARARGWDQLLGGLGGAFNAWGSGSGQSLVPGGTGHGGAPGEGRPY